MTSENSRARLALLESRAAITDLVHRYSYLVRMGRAGDAGALFAEDGTYEVRESDGQEAQAAGTVKRALSGRAAIANFLAGTAHSGIRILPFIHNVMIEVDGDRAIGNCIMESRTWPAGHESIGEYRDNYRREGTSWLFESRVYTRFQQTQPLGTGD
jgi:hypothetical protein